MEIFCYIVLGIVQGLGEFLPISSSGHLVLFSKLFGISQPLFLSVILHMATLLSIFVVLGKDVANLVKRPLSKKSTSLVLSCVPTCLIVLVLMPLVTEAFEGAFLPIAFLMSAVALFVTEKVRKKRTQKGFVWNGEISYKTALVMGVFQGIAIFPGLSRSGCTICGGILAGGRGEECAKFSFLMSIPIILLSMLLEIYKIFALGESVQINILGTLLAFVVAFVVGSLTIRAMIRLTSKGRFLPFCIYLVIISVLSICINML